MADCFPGNLVYEGSSSILFINVLVPIVLAPGAHICLQIIFLLKAKEQKPKPPKLESNLIQAHIEEIQHSQLYHSKKHEDNTRELLYMHYREKKDNIYSKNSYWEIRGRNDLSLHSKPVRVLRGTLPKDARDIEVRHFYFWQQVHLGKLLQSLVWPCSCWH